MLTVVSFDQGNTFNANFNLVTPKKGELILLVIKFNSTHVIIIFYNPS